ncbi:MAG: hypothetical protein KatS3mg091_682 [Patescibacteria group bacterium]|nr:MAG: hypothetical protein KatS3mg091_682 [Patescibacteria group bacterium]
MFFKAKKDQTNDIKLKLKNLIKDKIKAERKKQIKTKLTKAVRIILLTTLFAITTANIIYSQTNKIIYKILNRDLSGEIYINLTKNNKRLKQLIDNCCLTKKTKQEIQAFNNEKNLLKQKYQELLTQSPFDWRIMYNLKILSDN